jgi:purine-binding chemotaxis protein CheW
MTATTLNNKRSGLDLAGKYLTFRLETESYGIDVLKVREIIRHLNVTAVPQMPEHIRGVINLRGKIIPLMDLRRRFGFANVTGTKHTCIVVVQISWPDSPATAMGMVVDAVEEVININGDEIEETPDFGGRIAVDYILGMAKVKYTYDPFGNILTMSGPLALTNTYRFSSKEWNDRSGLYYYGYRFYDPNLQRWLNRDPIGEIGGENLFTAMRNSPLTYIDCFGLQLLELCPVLSSTPAIPRPLLEQAIDLNKGAARVPLPGGRQLDLFDQRGPQPCARRIASQRSIRSCLFHADYESGIRSVTHLVQNAKTRPGFVSLTKSYDFNRPEIQAASEISVPICHRV